MEKICYVIEHLSVEHCGTFRQALEAHDYRIVSIPAAEIRNFYDKAAYGELLIVMGGPIGVYDAADFSFLTLEIELIRSRLQARRPVLGICLGSQLMAAALGANVFPGTNGVEIGWAPVQLTEAGRSHPLSDVAGDGWPVLHWHGDTFELPKGATLLASTSRYPNQAFAIEDYGLALQFHVETDAAELEQWFVTFVSDIRKLGPNTLEKLRNDTSRHAASLARRNRQFLIRWLTQLQLHQTSQARAEKEPTE
jgi:GMP synthase (glutamine-hydrolysing)